jgi:predicted XRE-type DNA-binding protein
LKGNAENTKRHERDRPQAVDEELDRLQRDTFDNPFDALMDTPEEAANMTLRSDLMRAIRREVRDWGEAQTAAAARLGVSQPRLNDLPRNRIDEFSLDALVTLACRAGLTVRLDVETPAAA